jgi:hypothetical protein
MYTCDKCNRKFNYKCDYTRHASRITSCEYNTIINKSHVCHKCKKSYSSNSNLHRHIKKCKQKNTNIIKLVEYHDPSTIPKISIKSNKLVKKNVCLYCSKSYSRKDSLIRHMKTFCKLKETYCENREKIFQKLIQKMCVMENEINFLKHKIKNNNM